MFDQLYDYNGPQHCDFCRHRHDLDAVSALCSKAYEAAIRDGYPLRGEKIPGTETRSIRIALDEASGAMCADFAPMPLEALARHAGRGEALALYGS